jgi:hypothetical protein
MPRSRYKASDAAWRPSRPGTGAKEAANEAIVVKALELYRARAKHRCLPTGRLAAGWRRRCGAPGSTPLRVAGPPCTTFDIAVDDETTKQDSAFAELRLP